MDRKTLNSTLTACLLCFGAVIYAQFPAEVLAAEQTRFRAQTERDTATLRELVDAELLYVHSNGLEESRRDFLNNVATGAIEYRTMQLIPGTQRIEQLGRKAALVQGEVAVSGLYKGTPFDITLRYTSVYRKRRGRWHLLTWQSLKIEP